MQWSWIIFEIAQCYYITAYAAPKSIQLQYLVGGMDAHSNDDDDEHSFQLLESKVRASKLKKVHISLWVHKWFFFCF